MRLMRHPELFSLAIAHIDCDAFFAAVEKRDNPALADQPVIVGGGKRGVVSTCCYIARVYGVRSAMPMFKALQLCPDAVVIKGDYAIGDEQALKDELQELVRRRLSTHAFPREIEFVDELPKTPSGKIQRFVLRNQAKEEIGA